MTTLVQKQFARKRSARPERDSYQRPLFRAMALSLFECKDKEVSTTRKTIVDFLVRSRSPVVVIGTSAISIPGARSRAAASSAWVSASLLPRLPTRMSTRLPALQRLSTTCRSPRANTNESGRDLQGKRAAREVLQRSSSPRPNRCRTTSA